MTPEPGMAYQARIISYGKDRGSEGLEVYTNYEKALADALEFSFSNISDVEFSHMIIRKKCMDCGDAGKFIEATVSRAGAIIELGQCGLIDAETEVELHLLDRQIYVPASFKPSKAQGSTI